jgi:hypothetical protein
MTKTRQAWLARPAAIFMTPAIGTPPALAQRLSCKGDRVTLSPGCNPVFFFSGLAVGGDPVGSVILGNGTTPRSMFYAPTGGYTSFPQSPYASLTVGKKGTLYGTTTGDPDMIFQLKP